MNASDLFIAGGWSAAGGLVSGVGTRALQRTSRASPASRPDTASAPNLGMSDAGRGAVKGAISLPRAVFGMPAKEQGPKLVDRAMKGEL